MFLESKEKLEQLEHKVKNQIENLDSEQKKSDVLNQEALFIPAWEIEISDLNLISESQKLARKKEETDLELNQVSLDLLKLNSDKELIKNELQGNKDNLEKLEESVQNYTELLKGLQFFKENTRISEDRKKIEDRIREVQLKIETLRAEKDETLKGLVFSRIPGINSNTRLKEVLILLDSEKEKLNLEIGQMQDHILQLGKKEQLFQFTSQMVDGDPCPLCGSLHHPEIVTSEDVGSLVQSAQNQIKNLLALNSEIEKDYRKLHDLAASLSTEVEQLKTLNERLSASDASLENLKSEYSSNPYVSMGNQAVSELFSKSEQHQKDILTIKNRVKDLEESFLRVENSLEPQVNKEKSLKQILAGIDGQILSFKNQVKSLNPDTILNLEETASRINILSTKLKTTKENLELQKARLDALKLDLVSAEATKKSLFELVEKYKSEEAKLSERVLQKIEKENLTNMEEVRKTLDSHFDSEKIKLEIEAFFKQLDLVVNDLKNLKDKIHNQEFDGGLWEEAKESILNQKQNISVLEGELAVLIEQVKDIEIRQAKLEKLQNEKAVLEKRRDNLSVLSSLFKGKDFVNFVSSVYLKNVVDVANERFFRLTRQKLMLVLDGDNNFYVKDFLNDGHERLAKTLSGGQVFQASLSLALALADTVRHKTKSEQNFFFLDEGFGSLDKESLHLVFDTLRQLKHENRIVGVISHIEEMQQEIDQCLKIRMDEEFGSIIEVK
jgi:exonuclease SbcC